MIFAPIIIPTCNRDWHFQRCLESLQRNKWAPFTDLYISLDYPPAEKYVEGNLKIRRILENGVEGFRDVYIFIQQKNIGAYENERFLISQVFQKYDRYIFAEDDNVFAPNFIEYIDKGLELFEKSDEIVAICGTRASNGNMENDKGNITKSKKFIGYGFGMWKKKQDLFEKTVTRQYLIDSFHSPGNMLKLYREHSSLLLAFVAALCRKDKTYYTKTGDVAYIDEMWKVYMLFEKKYAIHPIEILAINQGCDGSGQNSPNLHKHYDENILSKKESFHYEIPEEINERTYTKVDGGRKNYIRCIHAMVYSWLYLRKEKGKLKRCHSAGTKDN